MLMWQRMSFLMGSTVVRISTIRATQARAGTNAREIACIANRQHFPNPTYLPHSISTT